MLQVLFAILLHQAYQVPSSGSVELNGAWRFRAGDQAVWSQPAWPDADWATVTVPGRWPEGTRGFGWYRAHVTFDAVPYHPVAIQLRSVAVAFEVFVDGERLGGLGGFPPNYRARSGIPYTVTLPPSMLQPGPHVIAIRVYSDESYGGMMGPVIAGDIAGIARDTRVRDWLLLGTALLLLGIGVAQYAFWMGRSAARLHLVLAVFCWSLAGFFLVWMPAARLALAPGIFWFRPFMAFAAAAGAAACFTYRRLFDLDEDRAVLGLGIAFVLLIPLALLLPDWDQLLWVQRYGLNPLALLLVITGVGIALRQRMHGVAYTSAVLWGALVLAVAVFYEVFASWGVISVRTTYPWLLLAGSIAYVLGLVFAASHKVAEVETAALYDRLTGLYRREIVMDALQREIRRAARTQQPITVIMMDVDRFKQVNDTLGHQVGDKVLAEVGRRLGEAGRAVDWLGRYGGEEFIGVLASTDVDGGKLAAERLRQAVSALPIATGKTARTITMSAGVASFDGAAAGPEWPTTEQLVGAADAALYRAKDQGRNMVAT
jgi:diguanylate cyclase (GGDEF)-like protein